MTRNPFTPYDSLEARIKLENAEGWRELCDQIPAIQFRPEWRVKVIPPFGGAVARFLVAVGEGESMREVSVYLDTFSRLGLYGRLSSKDPVPYWEMYDGNETQRFALEDAAGLQAAIAGALGQFATAS